MSDYNTLLYCQFMLGLVVMNAFNTAIQSLFKYDKGNTIIAYEDTLCIHALLFIFIHQ